MISHSQYQTMMVSDTVSSGKKKKDINIEPKFKLGSCECEVRCTYVATESLKFWCWSRGYIIAFIDMV